MTWIAWITLGLILLITEVFSPSGFFLFTLGLAGLLVGLLVSIGLGGAWWLQWLLFCIFALGLYIAGITKLKSLLFGDKVTDQNPTVGQELSITVEIQPQDFGQVELWGAPWRARNIGSVVLRNGDRAKVIGVEGVTLRIEKITY